MNYVSRNIRECFILILFTVIPLTKSQAIGGSVTTGVEFMPYSGFSNPRSGSILETAEVNQTKIYANASAPFIIINKGTTIISNSIYAERLSLSGRKFGAYPSNTDNLIGVDYSLNWIQVLENDWKTMFAFKPGLYYDGYDASKDIYRIQGTASVWKSINPHMEAGLGGGFVNEFGIPQAVPIFGLRLNSMAAASRPTPGTHLIDILIPVSASYFYVVSNKLYLGAIGNVSGGKYRLTTGSIQGDSVEFSVQTIGPSIRIMPNDHCLLSLTAGTAFRRKFQIRDNENNLISDFDLKNSLFGRAEASFSF